jgi:Cd2+/Zn2+-exporting ATPase/Cu+-exporting ATPase
MTPHEHEQDSREVAHEGAVGWPDLVRIGFAASATIAVWFRLWEPLPRVSLIGLAGTLVGGWPIFHEAWTNIRERRMTMELSMTIALVAALTIGEVFTALVITTFVLVAEVLEGLTVGRGRRAIRDLLDFLPATVTVRRPAGTVRISRALVQAGDAVLVAPGERIAIDGTVQAGQSYVDQAAITGESAPVEKNAGSRVYAGTINQSGVLEIVAERLGRDTSFGQIIEPSNAPNARRRPSRKRRTATRVTSSTSPWRARR